MTDTKSLQTGKKNKHITLEDRLEIQDCLTHGTNFKEIANRIDKDPTTVSREIKRHIIVLQARSAAEAGKLCENLAKAPFVCNGCLKRNHCCRERHMYYAQKADAAYRTMLVDCRTGVALNRESFYQNDAIIKAGVEKGQHIYHIIKTNHLDVSVATVYRHIKLAYSSVTALDLPRAVKFKSRKAKHVDGIPSGVRKGRTYDCFQDYIQEHELDSWLEMDTVIGRPGGKVLLTFSTNHPPFMFARLSKDKSAESISREIQELKKSLHSAGFSFGEVFPVVLTDNGGEFSNVSAIENSLDNKPESHLFFCDPYSSSQKPHVEKGHTMLRDILPKGSSFDDLTQEKVNLIFSHMNAVLRKALGNKSAYDVFSFMHSASLASSLGISFVAPDAVNQSPTLLK